jgi:hypothetical protein
MKALKLFFFGIVLFLAGTSQAQLSVRLSIGTPPMWGPAGYEEARYYYLPDVEAYYDVQSSMFIYYEGRNWVHRSYLPGRYRDYDLYGGYKVVMKDYRGNTPYYQFNEHRRQYARGYHSEQQRSIGERPGRGNSSIRSYRENNQVNRGRYGDQDRNDRSNDNKNNKNDRGHGDGNNDRK